MNRPTKGKGSMPMKQMPKGIPPKGMPPRGGGMTILIGVGKPKTSKKGK